MAIPQRGWVGLAAILHNVLIGQPNYDIYTAENRLYYKITLCKYSLGLFFFWRTFCICAVVWLFATAMERSGMRSAMCHRAEALQKV